MSTSPQRARRTPLVRDGPGPTASALAVLPLLPTLEPLLVAQDDGLCLLDRGLGVLYINAAAAAMIGRKAHDLVGKHVVAESAGLIDPAQRAWLERALAGRSPARVGPVHLAGPDEAPTYEVLAYPFADGLLVLARRAADESGLTADLLAAREDAAQRELLLDVSQDAIIVLDPNRLITYWSQGAAELYGWAQSDAIGRPIARVLDTAFPVPLEELLATLERDGRWEGELVHRTRDGRRVIAWSRMVFDRGTASRPPRMLQVDRDISDRKHAEEALQAADARLREIQHLAGVAGWGWDLTTGAITWSDELYRLFGRDPSLPPPTVEEMVGLYTTEAKTRLDAAVTHALATGEPFVVELEVADGAGTIRSIEDRGEPVRDAEGRIVGLRGTIVDLTERSRAEQAVRESEARYRSLFDNMLEGLAYCRMICVDGRPDDFVYLAVNESFESLTGLRNVIGKRVSDVIPGIRDSDPELLAAYGRVAAGGPPEKFEILVQGLDAWFSISVYSPEADHFIAVFDIITDRKRAEEALRASEQLRSAVVGALAEGVIVLDANGTVVASNASARAILGVEEADLHGLAPYHESWDPIHEDGSPCPATDLPSAVARRTGEPSHDMVVGIRRADGARRWLRINADPLPLVGGLEAGVVASFSDITHERAVEAQMRQAQKLEAIGRLAGGIAHDFNNILTAILGSAAFLADELPAGDARLEEVDVIRAAGERAAMLTRQLLAFGRRQVLLPSVLDINEVIVDLAPLLRRTIGEDVRLLTSLGSDVGPVSVDRAQLEQIVINLVFNARDAMPDGGLLTVGTDTVDVPESGGEAPVDARPGTYVRLTVTDTGEGMEPETVERIFEPFFTTKAERTGTGLGLATVEGIVAQSGGFIDVRSRPGLGSTFTIYLPARTGPPTSEAAVIDAQVPAGGDATILLVEDDDAARRGAARMLRDLGYIVVEESSSAAALAYAPARLDRIALLVSDVVMVGMNGPDLADRLTRRSPRLRTLFVSGYSPDIAFRNRAANEHSAFLAKPFSRAELAAAVRRVLDAPADRVADQS